MNFRHRAQTAEALGPVNRWYCSREHGRRIDDPELLWRHFIRSGGAEDFAVRYGEAMGPLNRWYCSQLHGRDIRDPETLWNYYMYTTRGTGSSGREDASAAGESRLSVAC